MRHVNTYRNGSSRASELPGNDALYRRIEADMRGRISSGQWGPGAALPTRRTLAKQYGVTTNTMNRALQQLIDEGTLSAATRHGTFVSGGTQASGGIPTATPIARRAATAGASSISVGIVNLEGANDDPENWGPSVQRAAEDCLSACGAMTRYFPLDGSRDCMRRTLGEAMASGMDAVLVVYLNDVPEWVEHAYEAHAHDNLPLMLVGTRALDTPVPHTYVDEHASGAVVADHLIKECYERLTFVAPFTGQDWLAARIAGARRAVQSARNADATLEVIPTTSKLSWSEWIAASHDAAEHPSIDRAVSKALAGTHASAPSAIIAPNDHTAKMIAPVLASKSLLPGRDIGLASFDDGADATRLGLTSMRHPLIEMATTASRLLVEAANGGSLPTRICEPARLIRRGSSSRKLAHYVGTKGI